MLLRALEHRFKTAVLPYAQAPKLVIGCSGGGDSIALLHLAARQLRTEALICVSVNHNLREEAASECAFVAEVCHKIGVEHRTVSWEWDRRGNLQASARAGRMACLQGVAQGAPIFLGHTRDDQVETFVMRLARGSGVEGLAAMRGKRENVHRPVLHISRADLRAWLSHHDLPWIEDPSNDDLSYDRIRIRKKASLLTDLGLSQERVASTAEDMAAEAEVLHYALGQFVQTHVRQEAGDVLVNRDVLSQIPKRLATRFLASAIAWILGRGLHSYKPRKDALERLLQGISTGKPHTLTGVLAVPQGQDVRLCREFSRQDALVEAGHLWDHRWRVEAGANLYMGALGPDGLKQFKLASWFAEPKHMRAHALWAQPALWEGTQLKGLPALGLYDADVNLNGPILPEIHPFFTGFVLSH